MSSWRPHQMPLILPGHFRCFTWNFLERKRLLSFILTHCPLGLEPWRTTASAKRLCRGMEGLLLYADTLNSSQSLGPSAAPPAPFPRFTFLPGRALLYLGLPDIRQSCTCPPHTSERIPDTTWRHFWSWSGVPWGLPNVGGNQIHGC